MAGQRLKPAAGGETAFAPLATQPCDGIICKSSRESYHRVLSAQRRERGTAISEEQAAGAHSASSNAPPFYRSQPPAKAKSPGGKGFPLDRSQTPAKSKGTGGKGRGKGSQSAGKGGKKGAHPGRGEHSRYAGYSEATSGAALSTQFQDSVPDGQAKGALPKGPPSASGRTDVSSGPVSAQGYMPESISRLSPEAIEEERRIAEAFNAFPDTFPTPEPQPVAPKPAPIAAAWKPHIPTMAYTGHVAAALAPEPTEQVGAGAPTEAVEPDVDPATVVEGEDESATVGHYPPHYKPAAVTVLNRGIPPPPPPTAMVGRHVTVYNSGLPGIDGESGHVTEYDSSLERYRACSTTVMCTTSPRIFCS